MSYAVVKFVGFGKKKRRNLIGKEDSTGRLYSMRPPRCGEEREYFDNLCVAVKGGEQPEVPVDVWKGDEARLMTSPKLISTICPPDMNGTWEQRLPRSLEHSIETAFSQADAAGISAFIVYDPSEEGTYHFISIARRSNTVKDTIQGIPGFEEGNGGGLPPYWYPNKWHPARRLGKRYMVRQDFRPGEGDDRRQLFTQDNEEKNPRHLLYVPLEEIVVDGAIPDNVLKKCVDSARFE